MLVLIWLVFSHLYLFRLIVLLTYVFICSNNLLSSSVDGVTTGTYNFVCVILNVAFAGLLTAATVGFATGSASLVALLLVTKV